MNNKYLLKIFGVGVLMCIIFCGCGKQVDDKENKLAQTHYKLCMLEVSQSSDKSEGPEPALRKALEHIQKAIKHSPQAEFFAVKATILFRLSDYERSCASFEQALKCDAPSRVKASILNNYACLLAQMGQADKALSIFDKLEKDSDYFTPQAAVFNKGKIFFEKQDYTRALGEFLQAIKFAPEYIDAHYFLALSALKLKKMELVKKELATVLFLDPGHQGAIGLANRLESTK